MQLFGFFFFWMEDAAKLRNSWNYTKQPSSAGLKTFIFETPSFGKLDLRFLFPFLTVPSCALCWTLGSCGAQQCLLWLHCSLETTHSLCMFKPLKILTRQTLISQEADMQFPVGFAKIPEFFFSGLFPTFFSPWHCLNYAAKGGKNLCICKACEHSVLLCQMKTLVFTFSVFFHGAWQCITYSSLL